MRVDIFDGLASLVDKSLIRQVDLESGESRLLMLETIREYAVERLDEDPEFQRGMLTGHMPPTLPSFTQRQWERLTGDGREAALEELVSDIENVRTAWGYWVEERDLEQLGKFVDSLWLLYDARGWYHATVNLTNDLLDVLSSTPSTPEIAQEEIMLQTSLARALLAIKGYTPEVEEAYNRALELSQAVGEIPQLFPVLRGLSNLYTYLGEHEKGVQIGEKILSLAERQDDTSMRVDGHLVLGYNLAFYKNLSLGLEHLETGIKLFDPNRHRSNRFRLGNNPGVACFTTSAMLLWMLGFPDRALERANDAVDLAKKLNHPYSMAYALFHTSLLHFWRGNPELVQACTQAALVIAEEHEFQVWKAVATCMQGAAMAGMGRPEEGLMKVRQGIDLYQGLKTPPIFWPMLLYIQAGVCGQVGEPEQGSALLDEGMEIASHWSGRAMLPEFVRLKGDLLLAMNPGNAAEAGVWLHQALGVAQELGAAMLELRAAISLFRLYRDQGKAEEGRQLLSSAYEKLTEGFTTVDLMEARELLNIS